MNTRGLFASVKLVGLALLFHGVAPLARAQTEPGMETPGLHGMLVLGSETIYVSHLPMFNPRHRYQGIWEVSFGADGDETYRAERGHPSNAGRVFSLNPKEHFVLPELTAGRTSFKAEVFVGHFERPGHRLILPDATVTLKKAVHFHPFKRSHRPLEVLTYIVFGRGSELFLAHWVSVAPSFDQILIVSPTAPIGELPPGAVLTLPGRSDGRGLVMGESASGVLVAGRGPEMPFLVQPLSVKVTSQFFLEERELTPNELP